jgi:hypothetical protein
VHDRDRSVVDQPEQLAEVLDRQERRRRQQQPFDDRTGLPDEDLRERELQRGGRNEQQRVSQQVLVGDNGNQVVRHFGEQARPQRIRGVRGKRAAELIRERHHREARAQEKVVHRAQNVENARRGRP